MLEYMAFKVDVAVRYGTNVAIILGNVDYWVQKNRENGKHFHDGRFWTYSSVSALHSLMPFLSERAINTALGKAEAEGLLVTGNYNKLPFDRTKWYALTEKGEALFNSRAQGESTTDCGVEAKSITPKCQMDDAKTSNDISHSGATNTKVKQMNNQNKEEYIVRKPASAQRPAPSRPWNEEEGQKVAEVVLALNEETGSHYRPTSKATMRHILARLREGFTVGDCKEVIMKKSAEWGGTDMAKYLRPETLFGSKFEGYLNAPVDPKKKAEAEAWKRLHEKYSKWDDEIEEW